MHKLRLLWFVPSPLAIAAEAWNLASSVSLRAERNRSSDEQFEALASGQVDAVVTAMDNVMDWNLRTGPRDLRVVAQLESTTPLTLVGRRGRTNLDGLRGASLLVDAPRNGFVVALRAMLAERGIDSDAYSLETVGGVKERFDALVAGHGDATLLGPPFDAMALEAGLNHLANVQSLYPNFPGQGLVVSARTIDRLRPALSNWLMALDGARKRIAEVPDIARRTLTHAGFPAPAVEAMLRTTAVSLHPDRIGVELLIDQRRKSGLPGANTSYEELVDTSLMPSD